MGFDQPLTVALVDECELVHHGITTMLAGYARRVTVLPPQHHSVAPVDIALVDPFTRPGPNADGPPSVRPAPGTAARVAVFTWEIRDGFVERAMFGGADGYLSKALPASELVVALEKVHAGERLIALDEPVRRLDEPTRLMPELGLTPRESDVIAMIAAGASNQEISTRLKLSMNTVKSHIRTAYRSMGVTSRTQAVIWAVEHGVNAPYLAVRRAS
ncbi:MAG: two-component system, NarL family, response regulator LiaR [Nocardioidaceae bacterium]|jgi:two-component system, NarL family, response regulator LiaR|nr:two-component system, NarL family, response regulator LiaR [Nocardioidaceae bacterium]